VSRDALITHVADQAFAVVDEFAAEARVDIDTLGIAIAQAHISDLIATAVAAGADPIAMAALAILRVAELLREREREAR
jgi:hypothetical protein